MCLSGSDFYNEKFGHCSQRKTLAGRASRDTCDGWEIRNLTISDFHHSLCLCCVEKSENSVKLEMNETVCFKNTDMPGILRNKV